MGERNILKIRMKKAIIICIAVLLTALNTSSQQTNKFANLNRFFAGIPLQSGFEKWSDYVAAHPYLGIDSTTERGNYSSFKPGIKSYFPFPDSLQVKILFQKTMLFDTISRQFIDSFASIKMEGIFGDGKQAKQEATKFYKGLRIEFKKYYRYRSKSQSGFARAHFFRKGKNNSFLNCSLHLSYSKKFNFFYILLLYVDKSLIRKKISETSTIFYTTANSESF
jgi:hypothetical protein